MEKYDKEILLCDLCSRLPYGTKVLCTEISTKKVYKLEGVCVYYRDVPIVHLRDQDQGLINMPIMYIRPYLFPLSSITEEQKNQLKEIWDADMNKALDYAISGKEGLSDLFQLSAAKKVINWFIKKHFDFQGLIPKELAIDATNLNIY